MRSQESGGMESADDSSDLGILWKNIRQPALQAAHDLLERAERDALAALL